jgi:hypothetical protein
MRQENAAFRRFPRTNTQNGQQLHARSFFGAAVTRKNLLARTLPGLGQQGKAELLQLFPGRN